MRASLAARSVAGRGGRSGPGRKRSIFIAEGDVALGLEAARRDLETRLGVDTRDAELMAASSAAGGLFRSRNDAWVFAET